MDVGGRMMSKTGVVVQCESSEKGQLAVNRGTSRKSITLNPFSAFHGAGEVDTQRGGGHSYYKNLNLKMTNPTPFEC